MACRALRLQGRQRRRRARRKHGDDGVVGRARVVAVDILNNSYDCSGTWPGDVSATAGRAGRTGALVEKACGAVGQIALAVCGAGRVAENDDRDGGAACGTARRTSSPVPPSSCTSSTTTSGGRTGSRRSSRQGCWPGRPPPCPAVREVRRLCPGSSSSHLRGRLSVGCCCAPWLKCRLQKSSATSAERLRPSLSGIRFEASPARGSLGLVLAVVSHDVIPSRPRAGSGGRWDVAE